MLTFSAMDNGRRRTPDRDNEVVTLCKGTEDEMVSWHSTIGYYPFWADGGKF